jgi:hypothetical protein
MSTSELNAFVERLARSGLLDAAKLEQVNRRVPDCRSAEVLARALINKGWLTIAQAGDLLAGPAPAAPRTGTVRWGWAAVGGLLGLAIVGVVVLLVRHHHQPPAPPGHEQAAVSANQHTEDSGKPPSVPAGPPSDPIPQERPDLRPPPTPVEKPDVSPPSLPPPPLTEDSPTPNLPTVAIDRVEPAEPAVGKKLTVQLKGSSPEQGSLRYQFRTDPRGEWRPAPDGRVELPVTEPGTLTLQVRTIDERDLASQTVERSWTVEKPKAPEYTIDATGLIKLKEVPPVTTDNRSSLIKKYRPRIRMTASSTWPGWPPENAIDDNIETSWFSNQNDAAALGKRPWLQVNFPENVAVSRVTILGNRDPAWLIGFTILQGELTLYDHSGKVLKTVKSKGTGNFRDFDFHFSPALEGVRSVRFTSLADQGNQTQYGDIAIADIQVE